MNERKYIAISLKHSDGYPFVLWGYHRTEDDEERCFAGYTEDVNKAELYTIFPGCHLERMAAEFYGIKRFMLNPYQCTFFNDVMENLEDFNRQIKSQL